MRHTTHTRSLSGVLLAAGLILAWPLLIVSPASAQSDEAPSDMSIDTSGEVPVDATPPSRDADAPEAPQAHEASENAEKPERLSSGDEAKDNAAATPAKAPANDRLFSGAKPASKEKTVSPMLKARGADYYDRRAAELLKEDEGSGAVEQHPLASAYPEQFVIVCEAGCRDGSSAQIVSMMPKPKADEKTGSEGNVPGLISCVGGCPAGGPGTFASVPSAASGGARIAATVGEWMTTVAQVPAGAASPEPKAASGQGSGDWMNQINADRAQAKPAAPVEAPQTAKAAMTEKAAEQKVAVTTPVAAATPLAKPAPEKDAPAKAEAPAAAEIPAQQESAKAAPSATQDAPAKQESVTTVLTRARSEATKPEPVVQSPSTLENSKPKVAEPELAQPKITEPQITEPKIVQSEVAKPAPVAEKATSPIVVKAPEAPAAPAPAAPVVKAEAPVAKPPVTADQTAPEAKAPAAGADDGSSLFKTSVKMAAVEPAAEQPPRPENTEKVISVHSQDQEMNAAIDKARASLDGFWKSYETPASGESDFALKVAITGNGSTEHFWLTRIERKGDKISGLVSNQPQSVKTVKMGQRYEFTGDMISDWTFKRNGKLVGNETMRVLLPRMPEEQAAIYRDMYETP